jgi:hypothetical protein
VEKGSRIRHAFFDCGNGAMIAFMEPRGVRARQREPSIAPIDVSA